MKKPEMSDNVKMFMNRIAEYNAALSELNTSFGGAYQIIDSFGWKHEHFVEMLANVHKNNEFIAKREAAIKRVNEMAWSIQVFISQGVGRELAEYNNALMQWSVEEAIR